MQKTNIEWTTFSANPIKYRRKSDNKIVWGCVKTSPGCAHCYSEAIALRFNRGKLFNTANMEELAPFLDDEECRAMRTKKMIDSTMVSGSRCFIGDMTDIFGEWVSDDILNRFFTETLERRTDVIWQLLTKRANRMQKYLAWRWGGGRIPCRHIHVGVSVENQKAADERIPELLKIPAAVRFLSCEPLLGPVDLTQLIFCQACGGSGYVGGGCNHETGESDPGQECPYDCRSQPQIHWVIVGGESGHGARPCDLAWIRSIVGQCKAAGVACFVKQLGASPLITYREYMELHPHGAAVDCKSNTLDVLTLRDKKGGDISEFPIDLRVREFPR